jgi:hypothetical protein
MFDTYEFFRAVARVRTRLSEPASPVITRFPA